MFMFHYNETDDEKTQEHMLIFDFCTLYALRMRIGILYFWNLLARSYYTQFYTRLVGCHSPRGHVRLIGVYRWILNNK